jgi:hypothetical protein
MRTPEGRYAGKIVPARPGLLRVGVEASGKTTKGKPFSDRLPVGNVSVNRVVARFESIEEKAIARDGSDKLARLEISAHLKVVLPGPYQMSLVVDNADSSMGMLPSGRGTLAAGEQTLAVSIPAVDIRKRLKDGPWTIRGVQISRLDGNYGDFVGTGNPSLKTAPYTRDQWAQGDAFTDEQVTAHGILPASSGRFRMVEADWGVTTPGGPCYWQATLMLDLPPSPHVLVRGILPKGRAVLSFVFDGAVVAQATKTKLAFSPILQCDFGEVVDDHREPLMWVTLDPAQFEPAPFFVDSQLMLRLRAGESSTFGMIDVYGKKGEEVSVRPSDTVPGISVTRLTFRDESPFLKAAQYDVEVKVDSTATPGRYFLPILATAGGETSQTAVVVDVVP